MRTTLDIDDGLLARAQREARLPTKTSVVELGLQLIIERAAARRLIATRGRAPDVVAPRRRRRSP